MFVRRGPARGGDNCIPRSLSVIDSLDTNMMEALMMFTNREKQQLLFTETEDPSTLAPDCWCCQLQLAGAGWCL